MELLIGFLNNLRVYMALVVVLVALGVASWWLPRNQGVNAGPEDYREFGPVGKYEDLHLDASIGLHEFQIGDVACFFPDLNDDSRHSFGWVVGKPGDLVGVSGGVISRNGSERSEWTSGARLPDMAPIVVPAGHLFICSTRHRADSIAFGPIPAGVVRGKIRGK